MLALEKVCCSCPAEPRVSPQFSLLPNDPHASFGRRKDACRNVLDLWDSFLSAKGMSSRRPAYGEQLSHKNSAALLHAQAGASKESGKVLVQEHVPKVKVRGMALALVCVHAAISAWGKMR